ncbi:MAG: hypothetical protein ACYC3I_15720 [Gemmataceae bacterium]
MTLNFNYTGEHVQISPVGTSGVKPVALEFQPVIVSGGKQVSNQPPTSDAAVQITIDPEKLKS